MAKDEADHNTKQIIIEKAAELIHTKGFRETSINDIIHSLGLTKGAFFYYFANKKELGYAIIEFWRVALYDRWVKPLELSRDALTDLYALPHRIYSGFSSEDIAMGCPLANLATELSPVDDDFKERILGIYNMMEKGAADAIRRGKEEGKIRANVDEIGLARLYVDLNAGLRSVAKNTCDKERLLGSLELFRDYLETLRS
jgi:AcrR family transcriptional regulator